MTAARVLVRARLCFDDRTIREKPPFWLTIPNLPDALVESMVSKVQAWLNVAANSRVVLFLGGAEVPPTEPAVIFRDGEKIDVDVFTNTASARIRGGKKHKKRVHANMDANDVAAPSVTAKKTRVVGQSERENGVPVFEEAASISQQSSIKEDSVSKHTAARALVNDVHKADVSQQHAPAPAPVNTMDEDDDEEDDDDDDDEDDESDDETDDDSDDDSDDDDDDDKDDATPALAPASGTTNAADNDGNDEEDDDEDDEDDDDEDDDDVEDDDDDDDDDDEDDDDNDGASAKNSSTPPASTAQPDGYRKIEKAANDVDEEVADEEDVEDEEYDSKIVVSPAATKKSEKEDSSSSSENEDEEDESGDEIEKVHEKQKRMCDSSENEDEDDESGDEIEKVHEKKKRMCDDSENGGGSNGRIRGNLLMEKKNEIHVGKDATGVGKGGRASGKRGESSAPRNVTVQRTEELGGPRRMPAASSRDISGVNKGTGVAKESQIDSFNLRAGGSSNKKPTEEKNKSLKSFPTAIEPTEDSSSEEAGQPPEPTYGRGRGALALQMSAPPPQQQQTSSMFGSAHKVDQRPLFMPGGFFRDNNDGPQFTRVHTSYHVLSKELSTEAHMEEFDESQPPPCGSTIEYRTVELSKDHNWTPTLSRVKRAVVRASGEDSVLRLEPADEDRETFEVPYHELRHVRILQNGSKKSSGSRRRGSNKKKSFSPTLALFQPNKATSSSQMGTKGTSKPTPTDDISVIFEQRRTALAEGTSNEKADAAAS